MGQYHQHLGNVVGFDASSYSNWSTQFTNAAANFPPSPASSLWKHEIIDLSTIGAAHQFYFRFKINSNSSNNFAGWKIDNVRLTYNSKPGTIGPYGIDVGCAFGHDGSMASIQFIEEEFFHAILGGNNWHLGKGTTEHTFPFIAQSWGIAAQLAGACMSNVVSGWDRWFLGWNNPPDKNILISGRDNNNQELNSDLVLPTSPVTSTFVLRDFVTTARILHLNVMVLALLVEKKYCL